MPQPLLEPDSLRAELDTWIKECGARVRSRRNDIGLTQATLAQLCDTELQTIWKVEHGRIFPREHLKAAVAYALATEVVDLWPPMSRKRIGDTSAAEAAA